MTLLVVDDEPLVLDLISAGLEREGYTVLCATCGSEALAVFERESVDLAILDYSLPDVCGADVYHQLRAGNPSLPVIFLTGHPNLKTAVDLMKSGARDYITKPFSVAQLAAHVRTVLNDSQPLDQRDRHRSPPLPKGRSNTEYLFGNSEPMRVLEAQVSNLARYPDTSVLITGPTGTGKSAIAKRVHELTWGSRAPFVEIDCSTIPRELCESELFGHEKGAFTGAHRTKQGLFEAAGHGTAFLDEIGELDLPLQAKFLRVLEARQFKRVGGHATLPMSARIIAATNRSLPDLVSKGLFREDLYFRLNVFELWMPPLKDRGDDVITLAKHFMTLFAAHHRKHIVGFDSAALNYLRHCEFPGNVRELRNMIERAVINTDGAQIYFAQLVTLTRPSIQSSALALAVEEEAPREESVRSGTEFLPALPTPMNLVALERQKLVEALSAAGGNKSTAAKLVGLSRTAFHRRLQKHQLAQAEPA